MVMTALGQPVPACVSGELLHVASRPLTRQAASGTCVELHSSGRSVPGRAVGRRARIAPAHLSSTSARLHHQFNGRPLLLEVNQVDWYLPAGCLSPAAPPSGQDLRLKLWPCCSLPRLHLTCVPDWSFCLAAPSPWSRHAPHMKPQREISST